MKEITLTFKQKFDLDNLSDRNELPLYREASDRYNDILGSAEDYIGDAFSIEDAEGDGTEEFKKAVANYILDQFQEFVDGRRKNLKGFIEELEEDSYC